MKRALRWLVALIAGLVGASLLAKRRKQRAWEDEPRAEAEWPPLAAEAAVASPATGRAAAPAAGAAWVSPLDNGGCPPSHPVKVKERSGIFHVDGNVAYERTNADRCYLDPASAEADGFRAAKS